ncbi:MAG: DUF4350 domain-containing protein [Prevotella sp.]|nr:DUF4350 domain-containing protein [Prevotella sp.]
MGRKFWLFIAVLALLMLALEYQMPRNFIWKPTYAHADRQPFGCYVFDSIMATTMPGGYTVCRKTLSQLAVEKAPPRSIIILRSGWYSENVNVDTLLALAQRGNRILLAYSYFYAELCDTLHINCSSHGNYLINDVLKLENQERDTVFWTGDSLHYGTAAYQVHSQFINSCLLDTFPAEPLASIHDWESLQFAKEHVSKDSPYMKDGPYEAEDSDKVRVADIVALSYPVGKGEIILVTTPLLFTNYGILNNPAYVHRLMNRLKPLPVVRTEAYMPNVNVAETSPFRELLKRPPLRWALYLTILGVVLLMGFSARRRQRAIPEVTPPKNYQLDFIRRIGTLQYQRNKQN